MQPDHKPVKRTDRTGSAWMVAWVMVALLVAALIAYATQPLIPPGKIPLRVPVPEVPQVQEFRLKDGTLCVLVEDTKGVAVACNWRTL